MLLPECSRIASVVLVATRSEMGAQGEAFGNVYEEHRRQWSKAPFREAGATRTLRVARSLVAVLGDNTRSLLTAYENERMRAALAGMAPMLVRKYIGRFDTGHSSRTSRS